MNKKVKRIIEYAIKEEEGFMKLYTEAVGKTEEDSVKTLLTRLAKEEAMHKEKLESLDIENLEANESISEIKISEEVMMSPIDEFNTLKQMLEFAKNREIEAKDRYRKISSYVEDVKAKDLLNFLAKEEEKHENLLDDALKETGI